MTNIHCSEKLSNGVIFTLIAFVISQSIEDAHILGDHVLEALVYYCFENCMFLYCYVSYSQLYSLMLLQRCLIKVTANPCTIIFYILCNLFPWELARTDL